MDLSGFDGRVVVASPGEKNLFSLHSLRVRLQEILREFESGTGLLVSEVMLARKFEDGVAMVGQVLVVRVRAEMIAEDLSGMEDEDGEGDNEP